MAAERGEVFDAIQRMAQKADAARAAAAVAEQNGQHPLACRLIAEAEGTQAALEWLGLTTAMVV